MAVLLYVTLTRASGPSDRLQDGNRTWQYYCMLHSPEPVAPQIGPRVVTEYDYYCMLHSPQLVTSQIGHRVVTEYGSITVCYTHHNQWLLR